jgi:hypothetical protein
MRTLVWFSAGAASAVAAKLALADGPAVLVYTDPGSEHPDNQRFIADCEQWIGQEVVKLHSEKYRDTWQVWIERRYLNGPAGALCTVELKKRLRQKFQRAGDRQVFGYTIEEAARADRFREQNLEVDLWCPLIEAGLTHADCLGMIENAGIDLPVLYKMGYGHNNCVPCVKGGMGYWNKVRRDFPEEFARMAKLERELDASCINGQFLDELDPERGDYASEPKIECSLLCVMAEGSYAG